MYATPVWGDLQFGHSSANGPANRIVDVPCSVMTREYGTWLLKSHQTLIVSATQPLSVFVCTTYQ